MYWESTDKYRYSNELYHFGIKGQKWGIRRYQNEDGTLTALGKERYGTVENMQKARAEKKAKIKKAAKIAGGVALAGGAALAANHLMKKKYSDMLTKASDKRESGEHFALHVIDRARSINGVKYDRNSKIPEGLYKAYDAAKKAGRKLERVARNDRYNAQYTANRLKSSLAKAVTGSAAGIGIVEISKKKKQKKSEKSRG